MEIVYEGVLSCFPVCLELESSTRRFQVGSFVCDLDLWTVRSQDGNTLNLVVLMNLYANIPIHISS
jgi:hypothetical protein